MKKLKLTQVEQEKLMEFRVSFQEADDAVNVTQLFNKQILEDYIDNVQIEIKAPERRVTSSMFSKRYAYLMIAAPLYSFSVFNKLLNVTADNLVIMQSKSNQYWIPEIYLKNQEVLMPSSTEERQTFREDLLKKVFSEHLNDLWNSLTKIGKIPKQILWENTSVYLFWLYETLLEETEDEEIKNRIKDDFHFILYKADGSLFGNYQNNPLTKFYHQKSQVNGKQIRVRRTCCFYFELDKNGTMCDSCPRKC